MTPTWNSAFYAALTGRGGSWVLDEHTARAEVEGAARVADAAERLLTERKAKCSGKHRVAPCGGIGWTACVDCGQTFDCAGCADCPRVAADQPSPTPPVPEPTGAETLLRRLDGWMDASGYDVDHPWRISIREHLAPKPPPLPPEPTKGPVLPECGALYHFPTGAPAICRKQADEHRVHSSGTWKWCEHPDCKPTPSASRQTETVCRACSECDGKHHFNAALTATAEEEPDAEPAKLGHEAWYACKHCDAWRLELEP